MSTNARIFEQIHLGSRLISIDRSLFTLRQIGDFVIKDQFMSRCGTAKTLTVINVSLTCKIKAFTNVDFLKLANNAGCCLPILKYKVSAKMN